MFFYIFYKFPFFNRLYKQRNKNSYKLKRNNNKSINLDKKFMNLIKYKPS